MKPIYWIDNIKNQDLAAEVSNALGGVRQLLLPAKSDVKEKIKETTRVVYDNAESQDPKLVMYGTGFSHNMTYGFVHHTSRATKWSVGYIHIDAHSDLDCRMCGDERTTYGDFVSDIARDTDVNHMLLVGYNNSLEKTGDLNQNTVIVKTLPTPREGGLTDVISTHFFYRRLKKSLNQMPKDVYVSIDLDVLLPEYIDTCFADGKMRLDWLAKSLRIIKEEKRILGADILGHDGRPTEKNISTICELANVLLGKN